MTKPQISARGSVLVAEHPELGTYYLYVEDSAELLFCENETNVRASMELHPQVITKMPFMNIWCKGFDRR